MSFGKGRATDQWFVICPARDLLVAEVFPSHQFDYFNGVPMMRRLNPLFLMASMSMLNLLSAAEQAPLDKPSQGNAITIQVNGRLQTGVMAIGAETTGTTIVADDIRFDVDWGRRTSLARRAQGLDGKSVRITGSLRQRTGPERGQRLIIEVSSMETNDEPKMSFQLDQLQWKKRPLLVFASQSDARPFEQQIVLLNESQPGLADRDMAIIRVLGNNQATVDGKELTQQSIERLRSEFRVPTDQFTVILVGKDGTEKLRRTEPVSMRDLFELIDSMPMRQREIR